MDNAPFTFLTLINDVFAKNTCKHAIDNLDNIVIYSPTKARHNKDKWAVLDTLQESWLLAKPLKCMFYTREIPFIRHMLSAKGINPDYKKLESIRHIPPPKYKYKLHTSLGMIAYVK